LKKSLIFIFLLTLNIPFIASAGIINLGNAEHYIFATASNDQWSGNLLLGSEAHIFWLCCRVKYPGIR
jgi:hypothetical protein